MEIIWDGRKNYLYRTAGERAVRAPTPTHAAWALAARMARRQHGRAGEVCFVTRVGDSEDGNAFHYAARLWGRGCATSVQFVVRPA